eukprot:Tamp_16690.p1 GENE.Tamp_16690~~Tamp_16690.p1  ORF type:complete len:294 (+),score=62.55 Tamp_16690:92-883(+)
MATENSNPNAMGEAAVEWEPNEEGEDPKVPLPYKSKSDITATTNKIYGMMGSPPCAIVRALFSYAEIKYEAVDVNFMTKSEISFSTYKKVPILTLGPYQINDSYIIIKTLAPLCFGRALTEEEAAQVKSVSYEAMIALEKETFEDSDACGKFVDGYVTRDCCSSWTLGTMAKLMMPQMAGKIAEKHPDLKSFKAYCETFKASIKGKFAGGSQPGPYDVAMYALIHMHKFVKIEKYEEMYKDVGLVDWYEGMAAEMANKEPIFW